MTLMKLREHMKRDGWLLAALLLCVGGCLIAGAAGSVGETQEARISRVLSSMEGAGDTEVAVYYDTEALPCGALVIAEGADSITVRLRLTDAVSTLLGLDPSAVAVYPLQGGS